MRRIRNPGSPEVWPHTWAGERVPLLSGEVAAGAPVLVWAVGASRGRYCCVPCE